VHIEHNVTAVVILIVIFVIVVVVVVWHGHMNISIHQCCKHMRRFFFVLVIEESEQDSLQFLVQYENDGALQDNENTSISQYNIG